MKWISQVLSSINLVSFTKKKTQQESSLQYLPVQSFTYKVFFILCSTNQFETRKKKNVHDAVNIPLIFKTNIKYICLKGNTFKSLTITNNADAFASSTKGWVQL